MSAPGSLCRDKLRAFLEARGENHHWRTAGDREYLELLAAKLQEEAAEAAEEALSVTPGDPAAAARLTAELADVSEVIGAICATTGITVSDIGHAAQDKRFRAGSYAGRLVWDGPADDATAEAVSAYEAAKQAGGGNVAGLPWIVQHRGGWCALPAGAEPDPEAFNDPTVCGHVVNMRGGTGRGWPDCPECLAKLPGGLAAADRDLLTAVMALFDADMAGEVTPEEDRAGLAARMRARCPTRQAAWMLGTLLVRDYLLADEALAAHPGRAAEWDGRRLLGWLGDTALDEEGCELPHCPECGLGQHAWAGHGSHARPPAARR